MSVVEVTHISPEGLWLSTHDGEYFLPFERFPWFRGAPTSAACYVTEPTPGHFYWPDLDVDLGRETIEQPERFPLIAT
jgi:Protein of unknown function (DUF2442)